MIQLTDDDYQVLLTSPDLSIATFLNDTCEDSKLLKPILEDLEIEHTNIKFYYIDLSTSPKLSDLFGVHSTPFSLFIKNDQVIDFQVAVVPKSVYQRKIQSNKNS